MISFESDYTTGAHPNILECMIKTNMDNTPGYGSDIYTASAIGKIKQVTGCPNAQIYLAVGGTQTNQLVISTMLRDCEGVVAPDTGHVAVHEAGAIEYSGHKVLPVKANMGKIDIEALDNYFNNFYADGNHEHMVYPGMVYISQPTEYGSLYTKDELIRIANISHKYNASLYIDGARLAYGLMSNEADFTMKDIADIADVFYIGGTKVGALFGEAIVFTKNNMPKHFITLAKQRGALLAKGRLLGIQFDTLFTDDLYFINGKNAIEKKDRLVSILKNANLKFLYESPTNQQFVIVENNYYEKLKKEVAVSFWEQYDDNHTVVRFATSWCTSDESLDELENILTSLN